MNRRQATLAILLAALCGTALAPAAGAAGQPPAAGRAGVRLIAPASSCPGQAALKAPPRTQLRAMRCLTNFARSSRGLAPLSASAPLDGAAEHKSADILACNDFSHEACGRDFAFWIERSGYGGGCVAENIAWGSGQLGSVRSIFRSWMHSPGHRENILGPYEEIGIGLRVGRLEGYAGARVWTQDFGGEC